MPGSGSKWEQVGLPDFRYVQPGGVSSFRSPVARLPPSVVPWRAVREHRMLGRSPPMEVQGQWAPSGVRQESRRSLLVELQAGLESWIAALGVVVERQRDRQVGRDRPPRVALVGVLDHAGRVLHPQR